MIVADDTGGDAATAWRVTLAVKPMAASAARKRIGRMMILLFPIAWVAMNVCRGTSLATGRRK
jgi:hypothetical protein